MDTILNVYPILLRGLGSIDASLSPEVITNTTMAALDLDGDGVITESEYVFAAYKIQKAVQGAQSGPLLQRFKTSEGSIHKRRDLPSVLTSAAGLSAVQLATILAEMEKKANASDGDLAKYLGVAYWDKSFTPEPNCSAILYISTSCGSLASNAAARCSDGGERVFVNSCRDNIGDGAFQCNMNGCSSLCYKINTDGCTCDALKYTYENHVFYADRPIPVPEVLNNLVECRTKCTNTPACIGFQVAQTMDVATVRCTMYDVMNDRRDQNPVFGSVSFRKVPGFNDSNPTDMCPPLTEGYRLSPSQFEDAMKAGEQVAEDYADSLERRDIVRRAPDSFDPRTKFKTPRKNQGDTELCASFTITTMVEASIMTKYSRTTPNELSPLWLAMCKAQQKSLKDANSFPKLRARLGSDYMATESCVPWATRNSPNCHNGCDSPSHGLLALGEDEGASFHNWAALFRVPTNQGIWKIFCHDRRL